MHKTNKQKTTKSLLIWRRLEWLTNEQRIRAVSNCVKYICITQFFRRTPCRVNRIRSKYAMSVRSHLGLRPPFFVRPYSPFTFRPTTAVSAQLYPYIASGLRPLYVYVSNFCAIVSLRSYNRILCVMVSVKHIWRTPRYCIRQSHQRAYITPQFLCDCIYQSHLGLCPSLCAIVSGNRFRPTSATSVRLLISKSLCVRQQLLWDCIRKSL